MLRSDRTAHITRNSARAYSSDLSCDVHIIKPSLPYVTRQLKNISNLDATKQLRPSKLFSLLWFVSNIFTDIIRYRTIREYICSLSIAGPKHFARIFIACRSGPSCGTIRKSV